MGYQFTNNWPSSESVFPSMIDHVDPVNQTYFTGLHQEIQNIETELGLNPSGEYDTVKARLDALAPGKMTAIYFNPGQAALPTSDFAELEKVEHANRNFWIAKYDKDTDEGICFNFPVPSRISAGNIRVKLYGYCNATEGIAVMYATIWLKSDDNPWDLTTAYTYGVQIPMTAKADANDLIVNSADDPMANFTEGKMCHISVRRDASNGDDNLAVDFNLLAIKIEEV